MIYNKKNQSAGIVGMMYTMGLVVTGVATSSTGQVSVQVRVTQSAEKVRVTVHSLNGTCLGEYYLDKHEPLVRYLRAKPKLHQPWCELIGPNGVLQNTDTGFRLGSELEIKLVSNPVNWFFNITAIKELINSSDTETMQRSFQMIDENIEENTRKDLQGIVLELQEFRDLFRDLDEERGISEGSERDILTGQNQEKRILIDRFGKWVIGVAENKPVILELMMRNLEPWNDMKLVESPSSKAAQWHTVFLTFKIALLSSKCLSRFEPELYQLYADNFGI